MKWAKYLVPLFIAFLLPTLVAASQVDESSRPEALGACPPDLQQSAEEGTLDLMILPDWLYRHPIWIEATGMTIGAETQHKSGRNVTEIQLTDATPVRGSGFTRTMVRQDAPRIMQSELTRGAILLLGMTDDGLANVVVSLRPDGSAVFIGPCEFVHTNQLRQFADLRASNTGKVITPVEMLRSLVREPDGELAKALYRWYEGEAPVPWAERSTDRRILDDEETPPDILATLDRIWVRASFPDSWRNLPANLCTKTSLGWNGCISLNAAGGGTQLEVVALAVPGQDLEVWLLDSAATISVPLSLLGRIPTKSIQAAAASQDPVVNIQITGGESATDLDTLVSEIKRGGVTIQN